MAQGVKLIALEREKQITKYGFTAKHHVDNPIWYENNQLQFAAYTLLSHEFEEQVEVETPDEWDEQWVLRMNQKPREDRLRIAGALIAAELDRITFDETEDSAMEMLKAILDAHSIEEQTAAMNRARQLLSSPTSENNANI